MRIGTLEYSAFRPTSGSLSSSFSFPYNPFAAAFESRFERTPFVRFKYDEMKLFIQHEQKRRVHNGVLTIWICRKSRIVH